MGEISVDTFSTEPIGLAVVLLALLLLLMMIWNMSLGRRLKKLRKRYDAMMNGQGVENLEQVIGELERRMRAREQEAASGVAEMARLSEAIRLAKGKVGVMRYNAFQGQGSDLSFSVAIVNDQQDGVVISGIHNREETYVYAKPLEKGTSTYSLSDEERKAISLAVQA
jgi:hypothetical protein